MKANQTVHRVMKAIQRKHLALTTERNSPGQIAAEMCGNGEPANLPDGKINRKEHKEYSDF